MGSLFHIVRGRADPRADRSHRGQGDTLAERLSIPEKGQRERDHTRINSRETGGVSSSAGGRDEQSADRQSTERHLERSGAENSVGSDGRDTGGAHGDSIPSKGSFSRFTYRGRGSKYPPPAEAFGDARPTPGSVGHVASSGSKNPEMDSAAKKRWPNWGRGRKGGVRLGPFRRRREQYGRTQQEAGLDGLSEGWEVLEFVPPSVYREALPPPLSPSPPPTAPWLKIPHWTTGQGSVGRNVTLAVAASTAVARSGAGEGTTGGRLGLPADGAASSEAAAVQAVPKGIWVETEVVAIFVIAVVLMLCAQVLLHMWRKQHGRSYHMVTLIFLWVVPPICALQLHCWEMLSVWCAFSAATGWLLLRSARRPLHPSTPRLVYQWFTAVYQFCMYLGCIGYFVFMVNVLFLLAGDEAPFSSIGGVLLCSGLYYGVMGRDFAEVCTDCLGSRIGFATSRREQVMAKTMAPDTCAICTQELHEYREGSNLALERPLTLSCGHSYHEFCLRGWTLVGKKDMCPFCAEKVDYRGVFWHGSQPQSYVWAQMLDTLRYLVAWNPLIVITTQVTLYIFQSFGMGQR